MKMFLTNWEKGKLKKTKFFLLGVLDMSVLYEQKIKEGDY